jgi:hypothetical protein
MVGLTPDITISNNTCQFGEQNKIETGLPCDADIITSSVSSNRSFISGSILLDLIFTIHSISYSLQYNKTSN